jgi:hypothetical protein
MREDCMATKAQEFRTAAERTSKKHKQPAPAPRAERLTHNEAHRLDRKSTHAIEEMGAHASRKSTRGSANRIKSDSAQRLTVRIRNASPQARATRKSGNPM